MSLKAAWCCRDFCSMLKMSCWLWFRFCVRRNLINPWRFLFVLLSIALATTLASAVIRVALASVNSFERGISGGARPYHALLEPTGGRLAAQALAPCVTGLTATADIIGLRRESASVSANGIQLPVRVLAVGGFSGSSHPDAFRGSRVIHRALAEQLHLALNDNVSLYFQDRVMRIPVTVESSSETFSGDADLIIPLSDLGPTALIDTLAFRFNRRPNAEDFNRFAVWFSRCNQTGPPMRFEPITAPIERGTKLLEAYRFNILIMAAITLLVCFILVSQATRINLRGIIRELAILRTLGLSQNLCLALIVSEAAVVSGLGALLGGVTLGAPFTVWIAGYLTSTASEIYSVPLENVGLAGFFSRGLVLVALMTAIGALAALLGAKEVLTLAPYRGTRREERQIAPISKATSNLVAVVVSLLVLVVFLWLRAQPSAFMAYLTIAALVLWSAVSIPCLLGLAPGSLYRLRSYLPLRLATNSLRVSSQGFVLTGIAVSVAISLLVGLALMVGSFRGTLRDWSRIRLAGDLFVSTTLSGSGNEGRLPPEVLERIQSVAAIRSVIPYYETVVSIDRKEVVVGGVDLKLQCARGVYPFIAGGCNQSLTTTYGRLALASETAARKLGFKVSQQIELAGDLYTIVGIVQDFGTERPLVVIDSKPFLDRFKGHQPETITIDLAQGNMPNDVRSELRARLPLSVTIRDQRELNILVETLFDRTFRITESVRWIVFIIALLGVISTISQDIWDRRRELRISDVLGISRGMLVIGLVVEALIVTAVALVLGVISGVGIGWCLTEFVNPLVFGWSLSFQVGSAPMIQALVFIIGVGALTPLVANRILRRVAIVVGLEDE